jgi:hypothetical protein
LSACLPALAATALLLAGCSTSHAEPTPPERAQQLRTDAPPATTVPVERPPVDVVPSAESSDELHYLVGPEHTIVTDLPPEVLASVMAALVADGHDRVARALGRLYDPATGRVRDPADADRVQARLRAGTLPPGALDGPVDRWSDNGEPR